MQKVARGGWPQDSTRPPMSERSLSKGKLLSTRSLSFCHLSNYLQPKSPAVSWLVLVMQPEPSTHLRWACSNLRDIFAIDLVHSVGAEVVLKIATWSCLVPSNHIAIAQKKLRGLLETDMATTILI